MAQPSYPQQEEYLLDVQHRASSKQLTLEMLSKKYEQKKKDIQDEISKEKERYRYLENLVYAHNLQDKVSMISQNEAYQKYKQLEDLQANYIQSKEDEKFNDDLIANDEHLLKTYEKKYAEIIKTLKKTTKYLKELGTDPFMGEAAKRLKIDLTLTDDPVPQMLLKFKEYRQNYYDYRQDLK